MRGDLLEEWRARGGTAAASLWYWRHALSLSVRYAWRSERQLEHGDGPAIGASRMLLDNLRQDLRFAIRSYAKAPSFTLAILDDAGARHRRVDGDLLDGQRHPAAAAAAARRRSARLRSTSSAGQAARSPCRGRTSSTGARGRDRFEGLALSREEPLTLTGLAQPERVRARRTTGNFLSGRRRVSRRLGRWFDDADDRAGAEPTVIVSHEFWQTHLGGDANVLGKPLLLDGACARRRRRVAGRVPLPAGLRPLRPDGPDCRATGS